MSLKVHYDSEEDILYLAQEGLEEEVVEVYPGFNLELDKDGNLLGVEILDASRLLNQVIGPLMERASSSSA
jgi:uncharacterized protein YuzE